jgi:hypothetical protein
MPSDSPDIWMRLHLHTPLSYNVQEGWLREVRSLMGMVINTTTFDDHSVLVRYLLCWQRQHKCMKHSLVQTFILVSLWPTYCACGYVAGRRLRKLGL